MGADVVKVEPPQGDGMRLLGPCDEAVKPLFHMALNDGKDVRRIDLKSPVCRRGLLPVAGARSGGGPCRGVARSEPAGGFQALVDGQPPATRRDMTARE
jgi:hypothetical protein